LTGHADLEIDWKSWDELCEYVGPWPWNWDCDFNPLEKAILRAGFGAEVTVIMEVEGSAGAEQSLLRLGIPLSKPFTIGGLDAGLVLTVDLFASAEIENVKMQTAFELDTGLDLVIGYDHGSGIDPDDDESACTNWHTSCSAKSDLEAGFIIILTELANIPLTWTRNLGEIPLRDDWSTGDLRMVTSTSGIDMDPDGFQVLVRRSDPNAVPAWDDTDTIHMDPNAVQVLYGGKCRELNPDFFDPGGVMGCDLVATRHELLIDGVMWNCAVQGEADRLRCIVAGEQVTETFDVECVSAYAFLRDKVGAGLLDGTVRNQGLARRQFHRQDQLAPVLLEAVDGRDVGVVEGRQHLGLAPEAGQAFGVPGEIVGQDLQGDLAVELGVAGQVDLAHAAAADGAFEFVVRQAVAGFHGISCGGWKGNNSWKES
jgi:hypothetical protein